MSLMLGQDLIDSRQLCQCVLRVDLVQSRLANSSGGFEGPQTFTKKNFLLFSSLSFFIFLMFRSSLSFSLFFSPLSSLFSSLVLIFSPLVFHFLSSLLFSLFSSLSSFILSCSLCLCVSVCLCLLCLDVMWCVVVCAVWCGTLKTSVCTFKTSPCMPTTQAHVGVVVSSAYQNLPTWGCHLTPEVNKRNPWILPIFSLRIGREQHVADSSNHSLCLIELFSFSNSWGTLRRVTWFGFSPSSSSSSTNMYVFVYVYVYVYVYAYVYVYVTFRNGLFSASSYIHIFMLS